jgi:hypothetical protein
VTRYAIVAPAAIRSEAVPLDEDLAATADGVVPVAPVEALTRP